MAFYFLICLFAIWPRFTLQNKCTRLHDEDQLLTPAETNEICSELDLKVNILIRIKNNYDSIIKGNIFYESMSSQFFEDNCSQVQTGCINGFLIDIFVYDHLIIIHPGERAKKIVNMSYRNRVIETLCFDLKYLDWSEALIKAINLISFKFEGGVTKLNSPLGQGPSNYLWHVLVPGITLLLISLSLLLLYLSKGKLNEDLTYFMFTIMKHWDAIEESEEKRIYITDPVCIFCWKPSPIEDETYMYCNHKYHERCLKRWLLFDYKACPCSYEAVDGDDNPYCYLTVNDLRILLGLSLDAFRKENMLDFFTDNEQKVSMFNRRHNVTLEEMCWIYQNNLNDYKSYRLLYKLYKAFKLMCCVLAFYPKFLKDKKVKLIQKLINMKQKKATVGKFV